MNYLRDLEVNQKQVLVRVDFNVPLKDGKVAQQGDWRIMASLPTIKYLIEQQAKIILLAHLGRPRSYQKKYSLQPVAEYLSKLLNQEVVFLKDCLAEENKKKIQKMEFGQVALLENLRFYSGEKENQAEFARKLSELGEVYVNDAFGVSHRAHASVVKITEYLPHCAGLLMKKEIEQLSQATKGDSPRVAIIGGVKISTKIKMIKQFLEKTDNILLGGALANTVIAAKGFAIGRSVVESEMISKVQELELTNTKLHIPVDVVASVDPSGKAESRVTPVGNTKEEEMILDIGVDTINLFKNIIAEAKSIIWNGPMGLFEVNDFAKGSREIAKAVAQAQAFTLVGGGDSVCLLEEMGLFGKIDHVSTGGGSMLKFLAGEEMPGIAALEN